MKMEKFQGPPVEDSLYPFQWHLNNTGQLEGAVPDADIERKFFRNAEMGISKPRAQEIMDSVLALENESNVRRVVELLGAR